MKEIIDRHEKIALQFSGGKDSLAVLHLMEPYWDKLTVYFLDSGEAPYETLRLVKSVRDMVPRFKYVRGRIKETREMFGDPSEETRFTCCYLSIMVPMGRQMKADGITLIIRGQKEADKQKGPLKSGHIEGGIEFLYPIEDWTDEMVFDYLREKNIPIPPFYREGVLFTPDCLFCTAWREYHGQEYVMRHYPQIASELTRRMKEVYG